MLHLVRDLREGKIAAANLAVEDRQAIVEYYSAQGLSVSEMAVVMNVSDSTIKRDRAAIRRANAITPGRAIGDELIAELMAQAENAIERLRRAARETDSHRPTVHQRMRAEINCFHIYRDLIRLLHKMGYIPAGTAIEMDPELMKLFRRARI